MVDGKGKPTPTGKLGDVAGIGASRYVVAVLTRIGWALQRTSTVPRYSRTRAQGAIPRRSFRRNMIATAICSALSKIPVCRDIATPAEIALRGKVPPSADFKEKAVGSTVPDC